MLLFTWVYLQFISIYVLTRVFCIFLYARVRLSELAFKVHLRSWSFPWRSSHLFCFLYPVISVMYSDLYLMYLVTFCCIMFNSDVSYFYIVASWTTISFKFRCIIKYSVSVICDFIYCIFWDLPNFIYNAVFWAIQVRHVRMRMVENTGSLQTSSSSFSPYAFESFLCLLFL